MHKKVRKACAYIGIFSMSFGTVGNAYAGVENQIIRQGEEKVVQLFAEDNPGGSGIKEIQYRFNDNTDWLTYITALHVSETATLHMRAIDNAGNISLPGLVTINVAPIIVPKPSIYIQVTDDGVRLTVTEDAQATGDKIQYVISPLTGPQGEWQDYNGPVDINQNGSYEIKARVVDESGKVSEEVVKVVRVTTGQGEQSAPIDGPIRVVVSPETGDGNIRIDIPDKQPGDIDYQWVPHGQPYDDDAWKQATSLPLVLDKDGDWDLYIRDHGDTTNKSIQGPYNVKRDTQGPVITGLKVVPDYATEGPVKIVVQLKDKSDVFEFSYDGGRTWHAEPFEFEVNENKVIKASDILVKDDAGNMSSAADCGISDLVITNIQAPKPNPYDGTVQTKPVDVPIDKGHRGNPDSKWEYQVVPSGQNPSANEWKSLAGVLTIPLHDNGSWDIYTRYSTPDGWVLNKEASVTIDTSKPSAPKIFERKLDNNMTSIVIKDGTDTGSGVKRTYIKINGVDATDQFHYANGESSKVFSEWGNYSIEAYTVDNAGNVSDYQSYYFVVSAVDGYNNGNAGSGTGTGNGAGSGTVFDPNNPQGLPNGAVDANGYVIGSGDGAVALDADNPGGTNNQPNGNSNSGKISLSLGNGSSGNRGSSSNSSNSTSSNYGKLPSDAKSTKTLSGIQLRDSIKLNVGYTQNGYMSGYADGSFKPYNKITRAEFAVILSRILDLSAMPEDTVFSYRDLNSSHWAYNDICNVQKSGLIAVAGPNFRPDEPITRAEITYTLDRVMVLEENSSTSQFNDVYGNLYGYQIGKVTNAGIMGGYSDATFRPNEPLTRVECVVVINRAFSFKNTNRQVYFTDISPSDWFYTDVMIGGRSR